jgi:hypothetical protein
VHLGHRGRAALVGVGVVTAVVVVLGVATAQYLSTGIAVLAGAATAGTLILWGLLSQVAREAADLGAVCRRLRRQVALLEKQGARSLARQRATEGMHKRTHKEVQAYSSRLEQLSMQVSFPVLQGRAPGEPISTRFKDYLDQPLVRESSRSEALLEQLARETAERRAFEEFVRANLSALADSPPPSS